MPPEAVSSIISITIWKWKCCFINIFFLTVKNRWYSRLCLYHRLLFYVIIRPSRPDNNFPFLLPAFLVIFDRITLVWFLRISALPVSFGTGLFIVFFSFFLICICLAFLFLWCICLRRPFYRIRLRLLSLWCFLFFFGFLRFLPSSLYMRKRIFILKISSDYRDCHTRQVPPVFFIIFRMLCIPTLVLSTFLPYVPDKRTEWLQAPAGLHIL